jgi:hypothetical protein
MFWRDKGWASETDGIGVCDNKNVIEQVTLMSEEIIKRFVKDERDAKFIFNSLRFDSQFGCIHHEKQTNE